MRNQRPAIAIIGSGPTAIYTAKYLLLTKKPLSITLFEMQEQAGKGTPYHQDWNEKEMLSNIASIELPPVTMSLVKWLQSQTDERLAFLGIMREHITERSFFPRIALGEYFHAELKALAQRASASGSTVTIKTLHKVTDVETHKNAITLTLSAKDEIHHADFDYVVMATGHAWPKNTETKPGYFLSPWPSSSLKTIKNCHVGIRGTSLSAIDALVALSVARGVFQRDMQGTLHYFPDPGTEQFQVTLMSRKGILPEADFYHPIPYTPLSICTEKAVDRLMKTSNNLLDDIFALFKQELALSDPDYAAEIKLADLTLEQFSEVYFLPRQHHDPFVWAEQNLKEAKANMIHQHTVEWRYAILRMHEIIGHIVPKLTANDYQRFTTYFKPVFIDDYATVPHESIERLLALYRAGKLNILALGEHYTLESEIAEPGALLTFEGQKIHFPAFIEAIGQRPLSVHDFPFPSLWQQGLLRQARLPYFAHSYPKRLQKTLDISGIDLDIHFHPVSDSPLARRIYCLSLPFIMGQFPFAQGITSSHDMGKKVACDMLQHIAKREGTLYDSREKDLPIFSGHAMAYE